MATEKRIFVCIFVVSLASQPVNKNLHHLRSVTATPFRKRIAQHKWFTFSVTRHSRSDVSYILTDLLLVLGEVKSPQLLLIRMWIDRSTMMLT